MHGSSLLSLPVSTSAPLLLVELRQYLLVEWLLAPVQNEEKAKKRRRSSMSGLLLLRNNRAG